jgi:uncharacterized protein (DUF433 family)
MVRARHGAKTIVIDPACAFGRPIAADYGAPTEILCEAVKNERSVGRVAKLYSVSIPTVGDAVALERQLAA